MMSGFVIGFFAFTSCQDNTNRGSGTDGVDLGNYDNTEMTEEDTTDVQQMNRDNSVSDRLQEEQDLSTFSEGMNRAELSDDFEEGEGPYTIFAPSNVAYDELSQEEKNQFENIEETERAGASMHYLVVEEHLSSADLREEIRNANGAYSLTTMQGEQLTASIDGNDIILKDATGSTARITETDLDAANGTVHVVDKVLRPHDNTRNDARTRDWNDRNDQMNWEEGDRSERTDAEMNSDNNQTNAENNN